MGKSKTTERKSGAAVLVQSIVRPRRIITIYRDPFDDTLLLKCDMPYDRRKSADGFYTRGVRIMREGLKQIRSEILEGRTPKVQVELVTGNEKLKNAGPRPPDVREA